MCPMSRQAGCTKFVTNIERSKFHDVALLVIRRTRMKLEFFFLRLSDTRRMLQTTSFISNRSFVS